LKPLNESGIAFYTGGSQTYKKHADENPFLQILKYISQSFYFTSKRVLSFHVSAFYASFGPYHPGVYDIAVPDRFMDQG
jgi:hypothetical protein